MRAELQLLDECYNGSLSLRAGCKAGQQQDAEFGACVAAALARKADTRPWFARFLEHRVQDTDSEVRRYEGIVLRGAYADQLRAFVCAGWRPDQFFVTTLGELHTSKAEVLARLAAFARAPRDLVHRTLPVTNSTAVLNARSHGTIPAGALAALHSFYAPWNRDLALLLAEQPFVLSPAALHEIRTS